MSKFSTPPESPKVKINRVIPDVKPVSMDLKFSSNPTDEEIAHARVFDRPILSLGKTTSLRENADLAAALRAHRNRQDPDDASAIENFLRKYPNSPRSLSLSGHLASHYHHTCQFTKAMDTWQKIWASGKDIKDLNGRQIVDEAVAQRALLLVTFGRNGEFKKLLKELQGRELHGAAAVKMEDAKNGQWQMENRPQKTYKCGPFSLSRIQATLDPAVQVQQQISKEDATINGTSLYQNWLLSKKLGLKYQMARRQPGAEVPVPSMMHWKAWHFSALTKSENGRYLLEDTTMGQSWISDKVLDEEASGYFLIPEGSLPAGWSKVTVEEGETIFGKSWPITSDAGGGGGPTPCIPSGGGGAPPAVGGYGEARCSAGDCSKGMAQYSFNSMRIGLIIGDIPVGYTPPLGPKVEFQVNYAERTIYQSRPFSYSNLGNQWTYAWLTYIIDNTYQPNADVQMVDSGGNSETFTGYDSSKQTYAVEQYTQAQLTKLSSTSYQCLYPNGYLQIFSQPDSTNGSRRVFITKMQDPAGNALSFSYDSNNRLVAVTDALGQVTTLSYGMSNDIYKITQVTDPFGRFATFQYNGSMQLTNIIDEIGISSAFSYGNAVGEADFINSLTTPYGTTTFTNNYTVIPQKIKKRAGYFGFPCHTVGDE